MLFGLNFINEVLVIFFLFVGFLFLFLGVVFDIVIFVFFCMKGDDVFLDSKVMYILYILLYIWFYFNDL